jgi:beta-glucanase (GH16 family)
MHKPTLSLNLKTSILTLKSTYLTFVLCLLSPSLTAQTLIWSDEFETDGLPDPSLWRYDVGGDGWGNNEAQFYTEARSENARVENGVLIIEAHAEGWPSGRSPKNDYTSARVISKGFGDWAYGRVEVSAKVPPGRGTWPAIWMLPTGNAYGSWPRSGEIDIMEHVGFDMGKVHGSLHSLANNWLTGTQPTGSIQVPDVATAFHVYAVEWRPDRIQFFLDDTLYYEALNPGTGWEAWPFDQPFYLIMNLAIGGFWGGQQGIDDSIFPVRMEIDYVRVYDLGDTVALDTDGNNVPNTIDADDDGDGLTDAEEHELGTFLINPDTDGDGYSDFDEVEAGTFPLLAGSFPGSDSSILMINNDFEFGEDPWIIHTNKQDAAGSWVGQTGSWGGAYSIFDYVEMPFEQPLSFSSYTEQDSPRAEHLLYQEWRPTMIDLLPGDVIRFRGVANTETSSGELVTQAFIRVLDVAFQPMPGTASIDIGPEAQSFELETVLGEEEFNVLQAGFVIMGPQSETGRIHFSDIAVTLNEAMTWGDGWAIGDDPHKTVYTGDWMGYLGTAQAPYVWSHSLDAWLYIEESWISDSGSWVFIFR